MVAVRSIDGTIVVNVDTYNDFVVIVQRDGEIVCCAGAMDEADARELATFCRRALPEENVKVSVTPLKTSNSAMKELLKGLLLKD